MLITAKMAMNGAICATTSGKIPTPIRNMPYPPIFSRTPASITLTAVGASVCASGSQVWNGNTGSFTMKAIMINVKIIPAGIKAP